MTDWIEVLRAPVEHDHVFAFFEFTSNVLKIKCGTPKTVAEHEGDAIASAFVPNACAIKTRGVTFACFGKFAELRRPF